MNTNQNNNKKILLITGAVILIALLTYWLWPTRPTKIVNLPSSGTEVIAFGDSLVAGVGSTPGNDFVSRLSTKFNIPIVNRGVPGETTGEGLKRVDEAIGETPRVVLLLLGGNDAIRRLAADETFTNLRQIIGKIQSKGAVVLLLGIRGGLLSDKYSSNFKKLAAETGSLFVPDVLDGLFTHSDLMSDQIHPNDKGYAIIADRITPVLLRALGGSK